MPFAGGLGWQQGRGSPGTQAPSTLPTQSRHLAAGLHPSPGLRMSHSRAFHPHPLFLLPRVTADSRISRTATVGEAPWERGW